MATIHRIAPSILSADFTRLGDEVIRVVRAGADMIHFDVMDNHYVPNLSFGPMVCQAIRPLTAVPIDVHLMVKPVERMITEFARAGADIITFHPEATEHVHRACAMVREHGCKVGLAFNPATPLHYLEHLMADIDLVLIMSVNPGFGGQKFIPDSLSKIRSVRRRIDAAGCDVRLQVDGGINVDNIGAVAAAGADTFVAGSAIFGSSSYEATIGAMRAQLAVAAPAAPAHQLERV